MIAKPKSGKTRPVDPDGLSLELAPYDNDAPDCMKSGPTPISPTHPSGGNSRARTLHAERVAFGCLLLSVLLHSGLVVLGAGAVSLPEPVAFGADDPLPDSWVGETFDIDTALESAGRERASGGTVPGPTAIVPTPEPAAPEPAAPEPTALPTLTATKPEPTTEPTRPTPDHPAPKDPGPTSSNRPTPTAPPHGTAPSSSTSSNAAAGVPGSFGAAGSRRGVRNLATAFARALPIANSGDPVWISMPLGPAGSLEVTLDVDAAGKITGAKPTDAARAPEHLVRLVERTLTLLRAGRFSLSSAESNAGSETFRLEAAIDQVEAAPVEDRSKAGPYGLGFEPPRAGVPGHATFTLQSGRRVTIVITLVKDGRGAR